MLFDEVPLSWKQDYPTDGRRCSCPNRGDLLEHYLNHHRNKHDVIACNSCLGEEKNIEVASDADLTFYVNIILDEEVFPWYRITLTRPNCNQCAHTSLLSIEKGL